MDIQSAERIDKVVDSMDIALNEQLISCMHYDANVRP